MQQAARHRYTPESLTGCVAWAAAAAAASKKGSSHTHARAAVLLKTDQTTRGQQAWPTSPARLCGVARHGAPRAARAVAGWLLAPHCAGRSGGADGSWRIGCASRFGDARRCQHACKLSALWAIEWAQVAFGGRSAAGQTVQPLSVCTVADAGHMPWVGGMNGREGPIVHHTSTQKPGEAGRSRCWAGTSSASAILRAEKGRGSGSAHRSRAVAGRHCIMAGNSQASHPSTLRLTGHTQPFECCAAHRPI